MAGRVGGWNPGRTRGTVIVIAVAAVVCCERGGGGAAIAVPAAPTYGADVAPILRRHCAACHHPGSAAPFSVLTWPDVRDRVALITNAIAARRMPPWLPEPGDYAFADERRLSDRELAIVERWAAQGAPEGAGVAGPARADSSGEWTLGAPDLVLEMREPFVVEAGQGDVFRNFVLPVPLTETRYVRAVELQPGDAMVVHHVVVAVDATPTSRQEDSGDEAPGFDGMFSRRSARPPAGFFIGWTPGRVPRPNPEGLTWPLEPGSDVVIQMHLRPQRTARSVRARIGFHFADAPPSRTAVLLRLGSQTLDIAAGDAEYTVTDSLRLPVDVELLGLYPHAHYLGRRMDVRAVLADGGRRQILRIERWDFNWQDAYTFARPVSLPAGTTLHLRYVYDNSAANPLNPNRPPRRVVYGPRSTDEMAELWIQAVPRSEQDLALLQRELTGKAVRDYVEGWQHQIRIDPADAVAHANLGTYHSRQGDAERAIAHYREAVRSQPDFASAHYNLAILLESRGARDSAMHHYREAVRAQPDHPGAHNNLGNALLAAGRSEEAIAHFRRAIAIDPDQAEARNNLGRLLFERGEVDAAIREYEQAIVVRPDAAPVHLNLAMALASAGRTTEAMLRFQDATRLDPRTAIEAHLVMAWLLATHADAGVRRPDRALALAEEAARQYGRAHARILDVQAAALAAGGQYERAIALAREAERLAAPESPALAAAIRERLERYRRNQPWVASGR